MYLPQGIRLRQFYHMRKDEANKMLEYWATRQAAGATPFYFKNTDELVAAARRNAARPSNQAGHLVNTINDPDEEGDGDPISVSRHMADDDNCS
jgi:hypothetical protein